MPTVTTTIIGKVLSVTLNRPEARNAIDSEMAYAIADIVDDFEADHELRVMVLSGAPGFFSAGMDLKKFAQGELPEVPGRGFAGLVERPPTKPTIAAVDGLALAGGFEIVLACDLVVASESSSFGLPEVSRGLIAAGGALLRLPGIIGQTAARHLALTGERIDAHRAFELGLVSVLSEDGKALEDALTLAATIASNAPTAVKASKQVLTQSSSWPSDSMFVEQHRYVDDVLRSTDAIEGATAFAEKRQPVWRG